MKIDFHTHGKLAKKLPFSIPYTNWLFDEAKRAGLDALCLTEHFNTLQFDEVYGYILSIGPVEEILALNRSLTPNKEPGHFLPFRAGGHIPDLPAEDLMHLDFLDLNGKDLALDRERTEQKTYALGAQLRKPVVSGSDTHQAVQYGCVVTEFPGEIVTLSDLHAQMLAGNYHISLSEEAPFRVRTATVLKRALKEIHALGGDYVQVLLSVQ